MNNFSFWLKTYLLKRLKYIQRRNKTNLSKVLIYKVITGTGVTCTKWSPLNSIHIVSLVVHRLSWEIKSIYFFLPLKISTTLYIFVGHIQQSVQQFPNNRWDFIKTFGKKKKLQLGMWEQKQQRLRSQTIKKETNKPCWYTTRRIKKVFQFFSKREISRKQYF